MNLYVTVIVATVWLGITSKQKDGGWKDKREMVRARSKNKNGEAGGDQQVEFVRREEKKVW